MVMEYRCQRFETGKILDKYWEVLMQMERDGQLRKRGFEIIIKINTNVVCRHTDFSTLFGFGVDNNTSHI